MTIGRNNSVVALTSFKAVANLPSLPPKKLEKKVILIDLREDVDSNM
jgi:hypothetical protein